MGVSEGEIKFRIKYGHSSVCNCIRRFHGKLIVTARKCDCKDKIIVQGKEATMGRWESMKNRINVLINSIQREEFISTEAAFKVEVYAKILKEMTELEALPIVEVEVPEEAVIDGHCSKFCPLQYGEDGWSDCKYNLNSTESIHQSYCKPGPNCPRHVKGEKE